MPTTFLNSKLLFILILFFGLTGLGTNSRAAVVFETDFNNLQSWNSSGTDACWENTPLDGGSNACVSKPWTGTWVSNAADVWNDYRQLAPRCSTKQVQHIGTAAELNSATGYSVPGYGGSGKSYLHIYEPCQTGSGSWGSDGLLGVYFGKTTGYSEIYVKCTCGLCLASPGSPERVIRNLSILLTLMNMSIPGYYRPIIFSTPMGLLWMFRINRTLSQLPIVIPPIGHHPNSIKLG